MAELLHLIEAGLTPGPPHEGGALALLQHRPEGGCHLCRVIKFAGSPHPILHKRRGGDAPEVVKGRSA